MYGPYFLYFNNPQPCQPLFLYNCTQPLPFPTPSQQQLPNTETPPIKTEPDIQSVQIQSELVKQEETARSPQIQKNSRFKYAKKNVESNVVNQIISYITTKNKSKKVLFKLLGSNQKMEVFYEIMKQAKKQSSGYMGRMSLLSILEADQVHPIYILHKKLRAITQLKLTEIKRALRIMTNHFLRNIITSTLLTSSKLDRATLKQHLLRAREVYYFVNNKQSPYNF